MKRATRIYGLTTVLLLIVLGCYVIDSPVADWLSVAVLVNLPSLLILACLPDRSWRRGLLVLGGLSLLLALGFVALMLPVGWSTPGLSLALMLLLLGLIPWVWVTWGFVWMFDSFWPDANAVERLKGEAPDRMRMSGPRGKGDCDSDR